MFLSYKKSLKETARWLRNNMTLSEVLLWQQLKGKQLLGCDFHRQKPILNYVVDFYCPSLKLIIEVDGFSHDFKIEYDQKREKELEKMGLNLLRFQDVEIKRDIGNVIQRIVNWIGEHTPTPQEGNIKYV